MNDDLSYDQAAVVGKMNPKELRKQAEQRARSRHPEPPNPRLDLNILRNSIFHRLKAVGILVEVFDLPGDEDEVLVQRVIRVKTNKGQLYEVTIRDITEE